MITRIVQSAKPTPSDRRTGLPSSNPRTGLSRPTNSHRRRRAAALANNPLLVELPEAEKWDGQLPTSMIPGSTVPFLELTAGRRAELSEVRELPGLE